jgi:Glycosyltransferase family 87
MRALQSLEHALRQVFVRHGRLLVLCLAGGGTLSWWLGQDINWDLKNYHLYNPYALLEGRLTTDSVPASLQSFFNPLADIPYFILATKLLVRLPRLLAFLQGLYFGALVYFVCRLNWQAFAARSVLPATTAAIASLIGVSGAGVVSEIGTTFNDIQGALFVLWGLYLLMPRREDDAIGARRALWAGVAFGVAVAVKLTSGYYVAAAIFAVLVSSPLATSIRCVGLACASTAACALLLCGPWALWVYHQTGSPVFPLFNEIFRSDWYPPVDYTGGYFTSRPFAAALLAPFAWVHANAHLISEVEFRDARFAAAWIAVTVILASMLARLAARASRREIACLSAPDRPMRLLFTFSVAAYGVWLAQLGALRFGIVPEVLTGMTIVLGIEIIAGYFPPSRPRAIAIVALAAAIGIALQALTLYPTWGRAPYEQRTYTIAAPPLPANSLVVLAGVPLSFIVPFLRPKDITAVGISHHTAEARGYRLFEETKRRIRGHTGPAFVVIDDSSQQLRGLAQELGITWPDGPCAAITTNVYAAFRLCQGTIAMPP